jgi:hypothetical protein
MVSSPVDIVDIVKVPVHLGGHLKRLVALLVAGLGVAVVIDGDG